MCELREIEKEDEFTPLGLNFHSLGHANESSIFRVRDNEWKLIGKVDKSGMSFSYLVNQTISNEVKLRKGDFLAGNCNMINNEDHELFFTPQLNNEMCAFYVMLYSETTRYNKTMECM
jgi:hypothetical protein